MRRHSRKGSALDRLTIVVNGRFLRKTATGVQRVGRGLIDGGRAAGLQLRVVAPSGTDDSRVDDFLWCPPGRGGEHLWEQLLLPRAARGQPILSLSNTAPLAGRKNVVLLHDLGGIVGPDRYTLAGRLHMRIAFTAARGAVGVITPSEQIRRELNGKGIPFDKIAVIHPALDDSFAAAPPEEVAAVRSRFSLQRPYFLHVGWWNPTKDAATVAAAHLNVVESIPHELALVGVRHPNFALVQLPDAPSIRRLGYVSERDMRALLTGAVALLCPSRYEGFGFPPLEALACGTPAIVSDIPVLRESTSSAAIYVSPGDVTAWADTMRRALVAPLPVTAPPRRTWAEAGAELRNALDTFLGG